MDNTETQATLGKIDRKTTNIEHSSGTFFMEATTGHTNTHNNKNKSDNLNSHQTSGTKNHEVYARNFTHE